MLDWMKHKLESRLPRNINNFRYADDTTLIMAESKELESEKGEWKSSLKAQHSENEDHGIWSHHFMENRWGNNGNSDKTLCSWAPKSLQMVTAAMKLEDACSLKKSYDQPRQYITKQRHYFTNNGPTSQSYGFSSSHAWMWELAYKESWVLKKWCFWTVVLEKTLESLLDYKEIKPVNPKGNQPWIFIGRTDAEAEAPILWPPTWGGWIDKRDRVDSLLVKRAPLGCCSYIYSL